MSCALIGYGPYRPPLLLRFLVLTERSAASGDENVCVRSRWLETSHGRPTTFLRLMKILRKLSLGRSLLPSFLRPNERFRKFSKLPKISVEEQAAEIQGKISEDCQIHKLKFSLKQTTVRGIIYRVCGVYF